MTNQTKTMKRGGSAMPVSLRR